MSYHYKSYKAMPNANHIKRASPVPQGHKCVCRICKAEYIGFGAKCPACILKESFETMVKIAESNAILETREQAANANFTNVGKNADKEAK